MYKSQIFLCVLISFVAGVGVRSFVEVDIYVVAILAAVGSFFAVYWFLERSKIFAGIAGILLIVFSFGIARFSWYESAKEAATILAYANRNALTLRGVVEDIPDIREKNTRLVIR